jgi:hypothetical protein
MVTAWIILSATAKADPYTSLRPARRFASLGTPGGGRFGWRTAISAPPIFACSVQDSYCLILAKAASADLPVTAALSAEASDFEQLIYQVEAILACG